MRGDDLDTRRSQAVVKEKPIDPAAVAIQVHERLHWQEEAERWRKIAHAQRDRIRDLEGSPERQLLLRLMTLCQNVRHQLRETRPELASDAMALEQGIRNYLKL